jgi:hypothetical protein
MNINTLFRFSILGKNYTFCESCSGLYFFDENWSSLSKQNPNIV